MSDTRTTQPRIPVDSSTRDQLRGLKRGAERYDDVVRRLLDEYGENE
jgi:hypothetical protein